MSFKDEIDKAAQRMAWEEFEAMGIKPIDPAELLSELSRWTPLGCGQEWPFKPHYMIFRLFATLHQEGVLWTALRDADLPAKAEEVSHG